MEPGKKYYSGLAERFLSDYRENRVVPRPTEEDLERMEFDLDMAFHVYTSISILLFDTLYRKLREENENPKKESEE